LSFCCLCAYTDQVQAFIALGPVVTAGHIEGFAKYLSDAVVEEKVNINVAVLLYTVSQKKSSTSYFRNIFAQG